MTTRMSTGREGDCRSLRRAATTLGAAIGIGAARTVAAHTSSRKWKQPCAETLPAFSQLLADRVGRLWVRRVHWRDAVAAGSLTGMPVVPSEWSVFDDRGVWLYDVTMPAYFEPFELGPDYVAGRLRKGTQQLAAIFALITPR